jgi:uncharacterized repeat protein (TIGR03843 family)
VSPALTRADALSLLARGRLEVEGRLVDASNTTLYARVELDGVTNHCVYKPIAGERPLWDFPDGTLSQREVAAFTVCEAMGLELIPPTAWRDEGPFGPGMVQLWIETDDSVALVDIVERGRKRRDWHTVLRAYGNDGSPVVLVHANDRRLQTMALMDAVINNADRKGGHILVDSSGDVFGVDHGVCFNLDEKLRTVLWGWAGDPLREEDTERLIRLSEALDGSTGAVLATLLERREIRTTMQRIARLQAAASFPMPAEGWPPIPWPAF